MPEKEKSTVCVLRVYEVCPFQRKDSHGVFFLSAQRRKALRTSRRLCGRSGLVNANHALTNGFKHRNAQYMFLLLFLCSNSNTTKMKQVAGEQSGTWFMLVDDTCY